MSTSTTWHAMPVTEIGGALGTDLARGLTVDEAHTRLGLDGANELRKGEVVSPWAIFAGQFQSVVIWVLIGAAVVSAVLGELADGVAILAIVVLNAIIGFAQEYRAERAVAALARLAAPRARAVRDGQAAILPAAEVVRGDLLLLDAGDLVAADARLVEAAALRTSEAPLTGESQPVEKHARVCAVETALADRRSMVFLGTSVAGGSGRAVVVATGMATEVGHIATLLETASSGETPLQRKLDQVARRLLWACSGIVAIVFLLGRLRGIALGELFLGAVSLAVAAIPEGLPAVITIALALGVSRMVRRNALVRRLPSVETLGSAEVICTDKTGTLTVGEMTARKLVTSDGTFAVTGEGYATDGTIFAHGGEASPAAEEAFRDGAHFAAPMRRVDRTRVVSAHRAGRTQARTTVGAGKSGQHPCRQAHEPYVMRTWTRYRSKQHVALQGAVHAANGAPDLFHAGLRDLQMCSNLSWFGPEFRRTFTHQIPAVQVGDGLTVRTNCPRRLDRALGRRPVQSTPLVPPVVCWRGSGAATSRSAPRRESRGAPFPVPMHPPALRLPGGALPGRGVRGPGDSSLSIDVLPVPLRKAACRCRHVQGYLPGAPSGHLPRARRLLRSIPRRAQSCRVRGLPCMSPPPVRTSRDCKRAP